MFFITCWGKKSIVTFVTKKGPWNAQVPEYHRKKSEKWVKNISNANNNLSRSIALNEESGTAIISMFLVMLVQLQGAL